MPSSVACLREGLEGRDAMPPVAVRTSLVRQRTEFSPSLSFVVAPRSFPLDAIEVVGHGDGAGARKYTGASIRVRPLLSHADRAVRPGEPAAQDPPARVAVRCGGGWGTCISQDGNGGRMVHILSVFQTLCTLMVHI